MRFLFLWILNIKEKFKKNTNTLSVKFKGSLKKKIQSSRPCSIKSWKKIISTFPEIFEFLQSPRIKVILLSHLLQWKKKNKLKTVKVEALNIDNFSLSVTCSIMLLTHQDQIIRFPGFNVERLLRKKPVDFLCNESFLSVFQSPAAYRNSPVVQIPGKVSCSQSTNLEANSRGLVKSDGG